MKYVARDRRLRTVRENPWKPATPIGAVPK
jgi:hypothetical protein